MRRRIRDNTLRAPVRDRYWVREARTATGCAIVVLGVMLLLDRATGGLNGWRAALWSALALLLGVILLPDRVTAGEDWVRVRGVLRSRRVRTDRLTSLGWSGAIGPRLVLRDALGGRVEIDPKVLDANPLLWHRIEAGARRSRAAGRLTHGVRLIGEVGSRVDGGTLSVLEAVTKLPEPRIAPRSAARTRSRGVRRPRR